MAFPKTPTWHQLIKSIIQCKFLFRTTWQNLSISAQQNQTCSRGCISPHGNILYIWRTFHPPKWQWKRIRQSSNRRNWRDVGRCENSSWKTEAQPEPRISRKSESRCGKDDSNVDGTERDNKLVRGTPFHTSKFMNLIPSLPISHVEMHFSNLVHDVQCVSKPLPFPALKQNGLNWDHSWK